MTALDILETKHRALLNRQDYLQNDIDHHESELSTAKQELVDLEFCLEDIGAAIKLLTPQ